MNVLAINVTVVHQKDLKMSNVQSIQVYLTRWHAIIGKPTILHFSENNSLMAWDVKAKEWINL